MLTQEILTGSIYHKRFQEHGDNHLSVAWAKHEDQQELFEIISRIFKTKTPKILDIGCGLGHFYEYLTAHSFQPEYHGIDIVPSFVQECRRKGIPAICETALDVMENYDYITAIGTFHYSEYEIKNTTEFISLLKQLVKYLYAHTNKTLIFTLLKRNIEKFHTIRTKDLIFMLKKIGIKKQNILINKDNTIYIITLQKE